jgi:preprotein translocase subunit Sec61beta
MTQDTGLEMRAGLFAFFEDAASAATSLDFCSAAGLER